MKTKDKPKQESVFDFPKEITFPEENIRKNIDYLEIFNGNNQLLNKIYKNKMTFSSELNNLFYFFNNSKYHYYCRNILRETKLSENHDGRLNELENILNNIDLSAIEDEEKIKQLKKEAERNANIVKTHAGVPSFGGQRQFYMLATLASLNCAREYEGLKGNMNLDRSINMKELYSEELKKDFKSSRIWGLIHNSLPLVLSAGAYALGEDFSSRIILASSFFVPLEAFILFCANRVMASNGGPSYNLLKEKSRRMDIFIEGYMKK